MKESYMHCIKKNQYLIHIQIDNTSDNALSDWLDYIVLVLGTWHTFVIISILYIYY